MPTRSILVDLTQQEVGKNDRRRVPGTDERKPPHHGVVPTSIDWLEAPSLQIDRVQRRHPILDSRNQDALIVRAEVDAEHAASKLDGHDLIGKLRAQLECHRV
ncbi:MAG TPA: hypothetical protein PKE00_08425, partial [Planctomycetota bacterium]|nr:hypothetical protein [Planctomycetota bacterium]